jgi:hypothetical protein
MGFQIKIWTATLLISKNNQQTTHFTNNERATKITKQTPERFNRKNSFW